MWTLATIRECLALAIEKGLAPGARVRWKGKEGTIRSGKWGSLMDGKPHLYVTFGRRVELVPADELELVQPEAGQ